MSIYYQNFQNWHLIIVNDGSNDTTESIIYKFKKDYNLDNKIDIINKENEGVNKAIETGLIYSKKFKKIQQNTYISYCDADDIWMRNKLEYQINIMEELKCDLSYHDLILIDKNENIIGKSLNKNLKSPLNNIYDNSFSKFCLSNHITSTTMVYKYEYIDKIIPLNKGLYQDWQTCLIISGLCGNFFSIEKPLAFYRRHSDAITYGRNKKSLKKTYLGFYDVLYHIEGRLNKQNKKTANYFIKYYAYLNNFDNLYIGRFLGIIKYPLIIKIYFKAILAYLKNNIPPFKH